MKDSKKYSADIEPFLLIHVIPEFQVRASHSYNCIHIYLSDMGKGKDIINVEFPHSYDVLYWICGSLLWGL